MIRVIGKDGRIIFDHFVTSRWHDVMTKLGGTHTCDGTNCGELRVPYPGNTPTASLDTASRKVGGFAFDAKWYSNL
jgi:hypothetical protein